MKSIKQVYFIGIGGIGMSAIARYYIHQGVAVAGYDRAESDITLALEREGAEVCYSESESLIPQAFRDAASTLVVYTPAVPTTHAQYQYFLRGGFEIVKRSKILGVLSKDKYVMAVSGTHGKTTTTSMVAHFNRVAAGGGSAFLGGIAKNFQSNLVLGDGDRLAVEADEFDRSFHQLYPDVALVTSCDADHLDIYGTYEAVKEAFSIFVSQVKESGAVVIKEGVELSVDSSRIKVYSYSYDSSSSDFYAKNITPVEGGYYNFDLVSPFGVVENCRVGIPGWINVENAVGAASLLLISGCDEGLLREAMASFSGVSRRFDLYINRADRVYMDDYAHHPRELTSAITSVRKMFPDRKVTVLFQPHLYSRTADFYREFAAALSLSDEALLLPIYPARELPMEGVNSELIASEMTIEGRIVEKSELLSTIKEMDIDVFVSFGAGDIDAFCDDIAQLLQ